MGNPRGVVWLPIAIGVAIFVIAVVIGGTVYVLSQNKFVVSKEPTLTAPIVSNSSQTKTYTNTQYGFSLEYPPNADLTPPGRDDEVLISFGFDEPNRGDFSVRVNKDVEGCLYMPSDDGNAMHIIPKKITVNNIEFRTYSRSDAASGYDFDERFYKVVKQNICFTIRTTQHSVSESHLDSSGIADQRSNMNALSALFDSMLQSFKFTDSSSVSVPGMSKYTDKDFGFSFWYPSNWSVTAVSVGNSVQYSGGKIMKRLQVTGGNQENNIEVDEIIFPSDSVTVPDAGCMATYYSDSNAPQGWMEKIFGCDQPESTDPYTQYLTMGGLLPLFTQEGLSTQSWIVPLSKTSAKKALLVTPMGHSALLGSLVSTLESTDPKVSPPISTEELNRYLNSEKEAFEKSYFTASPVIGPAPLTVQFPIPTSLIYERTGATISFGDGDTYNLKDAKCFRVDLSGQTTCTPVEHTYNSAGTYTAVLKESGGTFFGQVVITVKN
jgi:hypothetical protein